MAAIYFLMKEIEIGVRSWKLSTGYSGGTVARWTSCL